MRAENQFGHYKNPFSYKKLFDVDTRIKDCFYKTNLPDYFKYLIIYITLMQFKVNFNQLY